MRTPSRWSRERGAGLLDLLLAVAVLALIAVAGYYFFMSRSAPAPKPEPAPAAAAPAAAKPAPPPPEPAPAPPPAAEAEPAATPEPGAKKAPPKKAGTPPPAAATLATMNIDSDVKGASVFVDRQYVGTTPLKLDKLAPGTKQIKMTADGYEGIERSVELAAGDNPVTMKFREVRLDARTPVVHKHGMGSCTGMLVATVEGVAYDTTNKADAFTIPYAQLEAFAVDYLEKNLRVKQKNGKTWNFTDRNDNADKLFVFHRDVESARKKLADGYTAVR